MSASQFSIVTASGEQESEKEKIVKSPRLYSHKQLPLRLIQKDPHFGSQPTSPSTSSAILDNLPLTFRPSCRFIIPWNKKLDKDKQSTAPTRPVDYTTANALLCSLQRQSSPDKLCSMDPSEFRSSKEDVATCKKNAEKSSRSKRTSIAGLSLSLSSFSSPNRRGLMNTIADKVSTKIRPETPPAITKALEGPPPSNTNFSREATSRKLLASPTDRLRAISATTKSSEENGIHSWSDSQLASKYSFEKEIGYGNWGSCWLAEVRDSKDGAERGPKMAVKLVHRQGNAASNARVKALWNEFKVLRACGKPLHRNIVVFKDFIITPSYALVSMKFYSQVSRFYLYHSDVFFADHESCSTDYERCFTRLDIRRLDRLL